MDNKIKVLINLCEKAYKKNEVPVAALITFNNKIISKAYNKRNHSNNVLDHAEIIAIKAASKKLKNWRLNQCDLYVTIFPCDMCRSVINETRIKNVYYFFENNKKTNLKTTYKQLDLPNADKCKKLLTSFFKNKRY